MDLNWIKCEEGHMPEDDERYKDKKVINVLVTTNRGMVTKVQRMNYDGTWFWGRINGGMRAWMPLPEPYKENKMDKELDNINFLMNKIINTDWNTIKVKNNIIESKKIGDDVEKVSFPNTIEDINKFVEVFYNYLVYVKEDINVTYKTNYPLFFKDIELNILFQEHKYKIIFYAEYLNKNCQINIKKMY